MLIQYCLGSSEKFVWIHMDPYWAIRIEHDTPNEGSWLVPGTYIDD